MRKSLKQITTTAAAVAVVTFTAFGATSAFAAVGGQNSRGGDATQAYPAQDNCVQSPASTSYTPCWNNG
jgi:hypothetical protein